MPFLATAVAEPLRPGKDRFITLQDNVSFCTTIGAYRYNIFTFTFPFEVLALTSFPFGFALLDPVELVFSASILV